MQCIYFGAHINRLQLNSRVSVTIFAEISKSVPASHARNVGLNPARSEEGWRSYTGSNMHLLNLTKKYHVNGGNII